MNNENSKITSIYGVSVMALAEANIINVPGLSSIRVQGVWDRLPASQIVFSEKQKDNSDEHEINLKILVTDTCNEMHDTLTALSSIDVVCRLHTTSCMDRVVGTDDCPIRFRLDRIGQPAHYELHFKGSMPEASKLLQSF